MRKQRAETHASAGRPGDPEPESQPELPGAPGGMEQVVAELAAAQVTVSTIAIGDKPDLDLMRDLASWGNGRSYVASSDAEVPGLFVAETRRLLGESIVEEPFRPKVSSRAESIAGVDFAQGPPLRGYVVTRAKPVFRSPARGVARAAATGADPFGLGKTVAVSVRRQESLGGAVAGLGRLRSILVAGRARRHSAQRSRGHVVAGPAARPRCNDRAQRARGRPDVSRWAASQGARDATGRRDVEVVLRQVAPGRYRAAARGGPARSAPYRFERWRGAACRRTSSRNR